MLGTILVQPKSLKQELAKLGHQLEMRGRGKMGRISRRCYFNSYPLFLRKMIDSNEEKFKDHLYYLGIDVTGRGDRS